MQSSAEAKAYAIRKLGPTTLFQQAQTMIYAPAQQQAIVSASAPKLA